MADPVKSSPRDAQVMASILKDMGVTEFEPRVINQMLECTYRYVTDVLDDSKVYSSHAGKKTIDVEDIKLAVHCRMDHSFTTPPPRDLLMDIARHRNNQSLPLIKPYTGPKLPPDRYCLSSQNYRLRALKKPRIHIGLPLSSQQSLAPKLNTGGRLPVNINSGGTLQLVTRGVSSPSVTFVTRQGTPSSTPAPTIRFNPGTSSLTPVTVSQDSAGGDNPLKRKKTEDDDYDI